MVQKEKVAKSRQRRLSECETHLYFLWDAYRLYSKQPERFKQIASELRVLVGDHRPDRRLLLAMMEEYGFSYAVQPPGPPFDKQPIPMVGWRDDPEHKALANALATAGGDQEKHSAALEKQAALRRPVPFREFLERGLAVYIEPHDYSYCDLVLAVAQQIGSAHEATVIDKPLLEMEATTLGTQRGHVAPLLELATLTLHVGSLFLAHVARNYGFRPRYFVRTHGAGLWPKPSDDSVPSIPAPTQADVKDSFGSEGTIAFWLLHPHADWQTNAYEYGFGVMEWKGVAVRATKTGRRTISLEVRRGGHEMSIEEPAPEPRQRGVHVAVAWNNKGVRVYFNGQVVASRPTAGSDGT